MELLLLVILVGSHTVTASQMARHGSAPLWWTAEDTGGNEATAVQTITVTPR